MIFPLSVNHDADDLIKDSFSGRIFDYYRHTTCPSMVARNHVRNPYIYSVLPMAHSNRLIMHLVLALGGLQAGHAWGSPEATHFAIQNYMTAIKEFKTALTSWVSGVQGNFLCLLLATTLLSQYEVSSSDPTRG